jgi:hypothetical protein
LPVASHPRRSFVSHKETDVSSASFAPSTTGLVPPPIPRSRGTADRPHLHSGIATTIAGSSSA